MNDKAAQYLDAYRQGQEVAGGILYFKALQQSRLDGSADSLDRIDALLAQLRSKVQPQPAAFLGHPAAFNFCLFLAFYLGDYLSRAANRPLDWLAREQAADHWPEQVKRPDGLAGEVVGLIGDQPFLPLRWLERRLFTDATDSCRRWLEDALHRLSAPGEGEACLLTDEGEAPDIRYADGRRVEPGDGVLAQAGVLPGRVRRMMRTVDAGPVVEVELTGSGQQVWVLAARVAAQLQRLPEDIAPTVDEVTSYFEGLLANGPRRADWSGQEHARYALAKLHEAGLLGDGNPARMLTLWQQAADLGYPPAEFEMGQLFLLGRHKPKDAERALIFLHRAAKAGWAPAMALLGDIFRAGEGVPPNSVRAEEWYRQALAQNEPAAAYWSAHALMAEEGSEMPELALEWLGQAAIAGVAAAQTTLARCYETAAGVPRHPARAAHWYQKASAQGDAVATQGLADLYAQGLGVAKDVPRAVGLYRKAAEADVTVAWYRLGCLFAEGREIARDLDRAYDWMRKAADRDFADAKARLMQIKQARVVGQLDKARTTLKLADKLPVEVLFKLAGELADPDLPETLPLAFELYHLSARRGETQAIYHVASCYRTGSGIARNLEKALKWYLRAAETGSAQALHDLGLYYETGELGPFNPSLAFEYTQRAAVKGDHRASYRLACMYQEGRGVEQNLEEARQWMLLPAQYRYQDAELRLVQLQQAGSAKRSGLSLLGRLRWPGKS
ncbi:tetratricopeptide repeat protein [Parachitinimonas caeni]|uniref:Sel1 repeat family protein n=1 Tax=Parachitinimonas caeni TaxID=3031301 RepID=A0ABT7E0D7_9NEIS|nr:hypothetical protein [Parachitinimonas caeni]MDK2125781.1 hypothetical protein [Parachitinimonas caeni]